MRWMNLEVVIQSEVRKRKTNIVYYIYIYMQCRKTALLNLLAGQQTQTQRHRRREQTGHGRRGGRDGVG